MTVRARTSIIVCSCVALGLGMQAMGAFAQLNPEDMLASYSAQARASAAPARGQQFFTTRHGGDWSCASCHGNVPTQAGRHAATGKSIAALAPAASAGRFTDSVKTEKWFRRNCNDVLGRPCTSAEKADVLSWLLTLKP